MKLYLIRHGQSEANIGHFFAGQTQVELTEEGKKQATNLRSIIQNINFDKVYSSDLHRAIDTQKLALPDAKCEITPLLREIDVGNLAGKSVVLCSEIYGEEFTKNRIDYNFVPYGGESCDMLKKRVGKFLDHVNNSGHNKVVAFCHGGFITATIEYILGVGLNKYQFETKNCSVNIFEYKSGKWMMDLLNYTGKLE